MDYVPLELSTQLSGITIDVPTTQRHIAVVGLKGSLRDITRENDFPTIIKEMESIGITGIVFDVSGMGDSSKNNCVALFYGATMMTRMDDRYVGYVIPAPPDKTEIGEFDYLRDMAYIEALRNKIADNLESAVLSLEHYR